MLLTGASRASFSLVRRGVATHTVSRLLFEHRAPHVYFVRFSGLRLRRSHSVALALGASRASFSFVPRGFSAHTVSRLLFEHCAPRVYFVRSRLRRSHSLSRACSWSIARLTFTCPFAASFAALRTALALQASCASFSFVRRGFAAHTVRACSWSIARLTFMCPSRLRRSHSVALALGASRAPFSLVRRGFATHTVSRLLRASRASCLFRPLAASPLTQRRAFSWSIACLIFIYPSRLLFEHRAPHFHLSFAASPPTQCRA
jgi:hypothetical protein